MSKPLAEVSSCTIAGSEKGTLKELDWQGGSFRNLNELKLDWSERIVHLSWNDADETEVLLGHSSGSTEVFSLTSNSSVQQGSCAGLITTASMQGLANMRSSCVSGFDDGSLVFWRWNDSNECEVVSTVSSGAELSCIHGDIVCRHEVATGGRQNNLKLWDVERPEKPLFSAKNLPHDSLDLAVPIWIQSVTYPTETLVATGTAYHEIQLYDPRAHRRPMTRYDWGEHPILALDTVPGKNQLIAANTLGEMALLDLRSGTLLGQYRGACGSVRLVQCHKSQPLVLSCSLDRYVRLHNITSRKLVKEVYVKQRMCCGLLPSANLPDISSSGLKRPRAESAASASDTIDDSDDEDVWESMTLADDDDSTEPAAAAAAAPTASVESSVPARFSASKRKKKQQLK